MKFCSQGGDSPTDIMANPCAMAPLVYATWVTSERELTAPQHA